MAVDVDLFHYSPAKICMIHPADSAQLALYQAVVD